MVCCSEQLVLMKVGASRSAKLRDRLANIRITLNVALDTFNSLSPVERQKGLQEIFDAVRGTPIDSSEWEAAIHYWRCVEELDLRRQDLANMNDYCHGQIERTAALQRYLQRLDYGRVDEAASMEVDSEPPADADRELLVGDIEHLRFRDGCELKIRAKRYYWEQLKARVEEFKSISGLVAYDHLTTGITL